MKHIILALSLIACGSHERGNPSCLDCNQAVDAGPDAAPKADRFGNCQVHYTFTSGSCVPRQAVCQDTADIFTARAVGQVEHLLGSYEPSLEAACPEKLIGVERFDQDRVASDGCDLHCDVTFNINQRFIP